MYFYTFEILPILFWVIVPITLQRTQNSLDPNPDNDPAVLTSSAKSPAIDSGENKDDSNISFLDPDTSSVLSDVESIQGDGPQYFPNPTFLADDEVPALSHQNPPCSFGNPIVPGRNGASPHPLNPDEPAKPSKQMFCCTKNFLSCVKWFVQDFQEGDWDFADDRCDYPGGWSCCSGVKDGGINGLGFDGVGVDCEQASVQDQSEVSTILQELRSRASRNAFELPQLPVWFKQYIRHDRDICLPRELQPRENMQRDRQGCPSQ